MKVSRHVPSTSYSLPVQTILPSDLPGVRYCLPSDSRGGVHKKKVHSYVHHLHKLKGCFQSCLFTANEGV